MINKILSIILVVLMTVAILTAGIYAVGGSEGYVDESQVDSLPADTTQKANTDENVFGVLNALGIVDEKYEYGEVSEGAYSEMVGRLVGRIDYAYENSAPITYEKAVAMIIEATGYNFMARSQNDYYEVARTIKITKGADKNVFKLLYNTLNAEVLQVKSARNGHFNYVTYEEDTYLTYVHDASYIEGVLTACNGVSYTGDVMLEDGEIQVSDYILKSSMQGAQELLGHDVTVYFKGDNNAIYMFKNEDSKEVNFSKKDIYKITSDKILLKNEDDDELVFAKDMQMVYNGQVQLKTDESLFEPYYYDYNPITNTATVKVAMQSNIRMIDNNNDGKYDYAVVRAYRTYRTGKVFKAKYCFNDYYKQSKGINDSKVQICLNEKDAENIIFIKGSKTASMKDISSNSIVCIYTPLRGSKKELVIGTKTGNGKIDKIQNDGTYIIDGKEYSISPYLYYAMQYYPEFAKTPSVGEKINFSFDMEGDIADIKQDTSTTDTKYIYITGYSAKLSFGENPMIKYVDINGVETVGQIAVNAKVNDVFTKNSQEVINAFKVKGEHMPAKVKIKNNLITEINVNLDVEKPSDLKFSRAGNGIFTYTGTTSSYAGHIYKLSSTTPFIGIGFDKDDKIQADFIMKINKNQVESRPIDGVNIQRFNNLFTMVDYNEFDNSVGMVIMDVFPNTDTENWVLPKYNELMNEYTPMSLTDKSFRFLFCVNEASPSINDDGVYVTSITGLSEGKEKTYNLAENCVFETHRKDFGGYSGETAGVTMWTAASHMYGWSPQVRTGDILNITFNKDDEISEVIWVGTAKVLPYKGLNYRSIRWYMQWATSYGPIFESDGGITKIDPKSDGTDGRKDVESGFEITENNLNYIYKYNFEESCFEVATTDDIYTSDSILELPNDGTYKFNLNTANNMWMLTNIHHFLAVEAVLIDFGKIYTTK